MIKALTETIIRELSEQIKELELTYNILDKILEESSLEPVTDFGRGYLEGQMKAHLDQIKELDSLKQSVLTYSLICEAPEEWEEGINE